MYHPFFDPIKEAFLAFAEYLNTIDLTTASNNVFNWIFSSLETLFTAFNSVLNIAISNLNSLINFMNANSGIKSIVGSVWNALPVYITSSFILILATTVIVVMAKRL